jgi:DNA-binding response OmpR family regulator
MAINILIVDDERALAETLCAILIHAGFAPLSAHSTAEARTILDSTPIDLLISDVVMPGMNGYELAMYTSKHHPQTRIVLLSGNAATQEIVTLGDSGEYQFDLLAKPIAPRQLIAYIRSLFDPSTQQRAG